mmetsp:Transcript_11212/g.23665  ORF Transcript_11212/g.23665 Transcript_11212/m.23665 type:complete len:80 (+) Transcript_11212:1730-1969(+)
MRNPTSSTTYCIRGSSNNNNNNNSNSKNLLSRSLLKIYELMRSTAHFFTPTNVKKKSRISRAIEKLLLDSSSFRPGKWK